MRHIFRIILVAFAAIVVLGAAIVLLPCVTHRVHVVNTLKEPISIQIMSRDATILSEKLKPGEFRDFPIVSDVDEGDLRLTATLATGQEVRGGGFYIEGFPYDGQIYAFVITPETIYTTQIERPFISAFRSEPWRGLAYFSVLFVDILSCLDCSRARRRLIR